jgi:serine/threonine protein kinase
MFSSFPSYQAKAGKPIDSGGFGCIFKPHLNCENEAVPYDKRQKMKMLSKLMTNDHAEEEYDLIQGLHDKIKDIPNYEDYFLLHNINICRPGKFDTNDLDLFDKKCKPLVKNKIKSKNIHNNLDKIQMINMPYGGKNVEKYINSIDLAGPELVDLNNALIDLLNNGIIPMNDVGVFHCDIKDSNVLVGEDGQCRLIDWGLSFIEDQETDPIPEAIQRRPFQFNVPFSNILFAEELINMYSDFLLEKNGIIEYYDIRTFVMNYITKWNEIRGEGHYNVILQIFTQFMENDLKQNPDDVEEILKHEFTNYYIINYISDILSRYTNNGKLYLHDYLTEVYLKNIDIWGFLVIYLVFTEKIYKLDAQNKEETELFNAIKDIFIKYLYTNAIEPINIEALTEDLTNLNKYFEYVDFEKKITTVAVGGKRKRTLRKRTKKRKTRNRKS